MKLSVTHSKKIMFGFFTQQNEKFIDSHRGDIQTRITYLKWQQYAEQIRENC